MTKGDFLKATEKFGEEVELILWCSGSRHNIDTVVHEITEKDITRLVIQPGAAIADNKPRYATPLFGSTDE